MPRLSSWGRGGYRRSSIAKRIRDILNMSNQPPDSVGIERIALSADAPVGNWSYGPEVPNVSPVLTYHHQFDFNDADDVDLVDTWQEIKTGVDGSSMALYWDGSRYVALLKAASSEGDVIQYQETNFAYYSEEFLKRDLYFFHEFGYQTTVGTPESELYVGFTSTTLDAVSSRDYGYGFEYDPVTKYWSFVIENQAAVPPMTSVNPLVNMETMEEGIRVKAKLSFSIKWPTGEGSDKPELAVEYEITGGDFRKTGGFKSDLTTRYKVMDQPLRLTFAARQYMDIPDPTAPRWGTLIMPWILKEVIPKIEGIGGTV